MKNPLESALGAHLTILKVFVTRIVTLFICANLGCFKQRTYAPKLQNTRQESLITSLPAAAKANPFLGFILALCFGIGIGLLFLIVSAFAGAVTKFTQLTWLRRSIQIVSGLALLFVVYYYIKVFINLQ